MTTVRMHLSIALLADSFRAVPDATGEVIDVGRLDGATYRLLVRVPAGTPDCFEPELAEDETVVAWTRLASGADGALYRVRVGADRLAVRAYRHALQLDGCLLDARVDATGWHVRLLFPDRAAVSSYTRRCEADGMDPTIRAVRGTDGAHAPPTYDLTPTQAETLRAALESGYFDVPRRATLETLADGMGVSKQAVSERLRRGLDGLLSETVCSDRREPGDVPAGRVAGDR